MEIISNIILHSLDTKTYFSDNNICFLDIETTGLNRTNNVIYLIGLLYFDHEAKSWILKQFFANSITKEGNLLKDFVKSLSTFDIFVTFNGESFDLPFIESRLKRYDIDYTFDRAKSLDLYQRVKKDKQYLNLPDLKLKTIERSLGFFREDQYTGHDCIQFYYDYIKSKNIILKENILKHNYDDLVHMLDIIQILDVLDSVKSFYIDHERNPRKFTIKDIHIKSDIINIKGLIDLPLSTNIKYFDSEYSFITENLNEFVVSMEFKRGYITQEQQCIYVDFLEGIWVLMIEKNYCIENMKGLLVKIIGDVL